MDHQASVELREALVDIVGGDVKFHAVRAARPDGASGRIQAFCQKNPATVLFRVGKDMLLV
jgi:hypothetical protein